MVIFMKKILIAAAALVFAAALCSCSHSGEGSDDETKKSVTTVRDGFEDVTAPPETKAQTTDSDAVSSDEAFGMDDAVAAAREWLGESDPDTGYKYSYSFDEMFSDGGTEYFKVRVSWYLEEEDRYSLCGYLLVSGDGNSIRKFNW